MTIINKSLVNQFAHQEHPFEATTLRTRVKKDGLKTTISQTYLAPATRKINGMWQRETKFRVFEVIEQTDFGTDFWWEEQEITEQDGTLIDIYDVFKMERRSDGHVWYEIIDDYGERFEVEPTGIENQWTIKE